MNKTEKGFGLSELVVSIFIITFIIVFCIGWVKNVVALIDCDFEEPYKAEVIHAIGIFAAPFGAVVGYMDIEDKKGWEIDE